MGTAATLPYLAVDNPCSMLKGFLPVKQQSRGHGCVYILATLYGVKAQRRAGSGGRCCIGAPCSKASKTQEPGKKKRAPADSREWSARFAFLAFPSGESCCKLCIFRSQVFAMCVYFHLIRSSFGCLGRLPAATDGVLRAKFASLCCVLCVSGPRAWLFSACMDWMADWMCI